MRSHLIPGGLMAAMAGATMMIAASSAPASAFTLSSPSLAEPALKADVQPAYWGHWHRWGWGWHRWGWGWHRHYWLYHPWYRPWWHHCWWTWYGRVCRW
jgi:hypothetical protein